MPITPSHLYVAFLDVLAYKCYLDRDRSSGDIDFQNRLSCSLAVLDNVNEAINNVQAISDTIIITCINHAHFPEFLDLLRNIFVSFLSNGLFIRGGVAYSRHFQNSRLTYSHAIARAYELESQSAIYPRIIVDSNIIDMYNSGNDLPQIHSKGLLCKEKDIFFVDILTQTNWKIVYQYAIDAYRLSCESSLNETAFSKHLRFERYLLQSQYAPTDAKPYTNTIETF